ncbi:MAG: GC-type dockerin domain-anchored protein, partial [Planctomycetota bacterium]
DLDSDGNTTEPCPRDLDDRPRLVDDPQADDCRQAPGQCGDPPVVDMGAYEYQPPPCPCDCEDLPDGTVDVGDFLALLAQWGNPGTCDCEDRPDGAVDVGDFLAILAAWGLCP